MAADDDKKSGKGEAAPTVELLVSGIDFTQSEIDDIS